MGKERMATRHVGEKAVNATGFALGAPVPRGVLAAFVVLAFLVLLAPSVGMIWAPTDETTENRELAEFPALQTDGGAPNASFLPELGTYFEDHFAFRTYLVTANAHLKALFGVSSSDQVVLGTDGWLYYDGTLADYKGTSALSDRALQNIAHNMRMAQDYVEAHGARFALTFAPNKNSLFPEHMPYYHLQGEGASNLDRLKGFLAEEDVNYVDLKSFLAAREDTRYLQRDTHWDNVTALLAGNEVLDAVGYDPVDLSPESAAWREDFIGDLQSMLYPADKTTEANGYFDGVNDGPGFSGSTWRYVDGSSVEDDWVQTESDAAAGNLLVFRDSFGNALLPFWAQANRSVAFSKLIPYNLPMMTSTKADAVIIERAERHIDYLAENPPVMPNPVVKGVPWDAGADNPSAGATLTASMNGSYLVLRGTVDEGICDSASRIYVAIENSAGEMRVYKPFWVSVTADGEMAASDYGYQVYLSSGVSAIDDAIVRVCVVDGEGMAHESAFEHVTLQ